MGKIDIRNLSTYQEHIAVLCVYYYLLLGENTKMMDDYGLRIRHRNNSSIYYVIDKENAAEAAEEVKYD